ncbi:hypothetical protein ACM01_17805 [Streptomyces viridochromogenes]|uniref:Secreted protein n=1 Tax=Streptomyces viridochromogenes TaxID=1938 RepID=A0A0J7ZDZ7_STRVR|nr:hypothetical protein [Streptomyces viridochromogenes]KMS73597.1 hypothetical protein ACM01_17805 [Streptomyces viridochromogenes]KOG07897.1 hypothetical protein ADK36_44060 [Streptomyces viridochromogenes]KOG28345.1 hypothetical protein ADK35_03795 [Streptomyces viridochromogenes]
MLRAKWSPWTTWTHGRRCALLGASAAVVCLGGALAACGGGGGGDGYVATGAAGGPPRVSGTAVAPTGGVTLVPLDGPEGDRGAGNSPGLEGSQAPSAGPAGNERPAGRPSDAAREPAVAPTDSATPPGSSPTPSSPPSPPAPATTAAPASPAKLTVSAPVREPTDKRWCEKVTLDFRNSGGTAVRSGTVTFGTHIIGALGIDWATVESTEELPAPIGAGAREEKTWTVCVDAWRVPLGMRVETRDVSVRWK